MLSILDNRFEVFEFSYLGQEKGELSMRSLADVQSPEYAAARGQVLANLRELPEGKVKAFAVLGASYSADELVAEVERNSAAGIHMVTMWIDDQRDEEDVSDLLMQEQARRRRMRFRPRFRNTRIGRSMRQLFSFL